MSSKKDPWFVSERSEAMAGLLLTSREDVRVREERKRDDGVDFLVEAGTGDNLSTRIFVVQVKGTAATNLADWMEDVQSLFRADKSSIFVPACVFVVNVRDNRAYYAWAAEPQVQPKGAALRFHETGDFHEFDPAAVNEIADRVTAWYGVLPKQLMPA